MILQIPTAILNFFTKRRENDKPVDQQARVENITTKRESKISVSSGFPHQHAKRHSKVSINSEFYHKRGKRESNFSVNSEFAHKHGERRLSRRRWSSQIYTEDHFQGIQGIQEPQ